MQSTLINTYASITHISTISKFYLLKELNGWLIFFILNTCKQVLWQTMNTQTVAFHQCLLCLLRKIDINFKTVNRFKYTMDYSIVLVSMCIELSTRIKGVKDERLFFLRKMPQNLALFFGKRWPKIWL